ncbi:MAG: hypothetical protein NT133_25875, partial [Alphaproteobacteria bacterium]|nr:hypothetical protein [Alphaproteobacteria bacterium]
RSAFVLPHMLNAPLMTWDSELITVIPVRMARRLAAMMDLAWQPVPFAIDPLRIELIWPARAETDPAVAWFRTVLTDIARGL